MPVCPLCEHAQESGHECDVCGRRLAGDPPDEAVSSSPLEGFEPTQGVPAAVDAALLTDLEPTEGFEPTQEVPATVDAALLTDLEPTALAAAPGQNREPPGSVACLYCARVGAPGELFCPSCGVRLPLPHPPASPAAVPEPDRRCRACGIPVAGEVCPACGTRHREA